MKPNQIGVIGLLRVFLSTKTLIKFKCCLLLRKYDRFQFTFADYSTVYLIIIWCVCVLLEIFRSLSWMKQHKFIYPGRVRSQHTLLPSFLGSSSHLWGPFYVLKVLPTCSVSSTSRNIDFCVGKGILQWIGAKLVRYVTHVQWESYKNLSIGSSLLSTPAVGKLPPAKLEINFYLIIQLKLSFHKLFKFLFFQKCVTLRQ